MMFNLFKKKENKRTFETLGIDIHCHLLPLVDDGSRSLEESLDVMEAMKEVGFDEIVLTPHFNLKYANTEDDIHRRYESFMGEVDQYRSSRNLPIIKCVGGEYRLDDRFKKYKEGNMNVVHSVNPKDESAKGILLFELPLHQPVLGAEQEIFDLQMEGYDIILAHPERYPYYNSSSEAMQQFKEQGVYFQVNILSLDGFYGEASMMKAYDYIDHGWVVFLATDMHDIRYGNALRHASKNKRIIKLLKEHTFQNRNYFLNH